MKVILKTNVSKLGTSGDIVTVKDGYARNFLIPGNMAMAVNAGNIRMIETLKKRETLRIMAEEERAKTLAANAARHVYTFKAKAGKAAKLFGSITAAAIAEAVTAKLGTAVDKRDILLDHGIKTLGTHEVEIRFFREIRGIVKVVVEAEESAVEAVGAETTAVTE